MRTFMLAVTGLVIAVAACSSYGTSVVEVTKTKAPVASVSLSIPSSLAAGNTVRAIATPKDANGTVLTDRSVKWYTSSAAIASVSDSGVISAVAPGTALVSAVSEGVSGQATMAVTPPTPTPIATLTVTVSPSAILIGQIAVATATLKDSTGTPLSDRTVTWESSNLSVATVDGAGAVKATGTGNAMIKASSEGKSNSSALSVSAPAPVPVASVTVSPASASLQVGSTAQLSAVTSDANNNLLTGRVIGWSSSNTGVATVSSSGLVTGVASGSVSVTAASEGKTASSAITVSAPAPIPVASVSISPASATLQVGGTVQLSAVTFDANNNVLRGRVITWSSGNTAVATVSTAGVVTAVAAGSVSITASSEGKTATAAITVSAPAQVPVASVTVSPATSTLQVGGSVQLSAVTRDANNNVLTGRVITWGSSSTGVSTVSASGLVTAVAAGSATITATSEGKNATSATTVSAPAPVPVASVSVSPVSTSVQAGSTAQFSAVTRDANNNVLTGRSITWSSSNGAVATVSASGLGTSVAVGTAQITATSEGKSGSATLTVTSPPPPPPPGSSNEPAGMTVIAERAFNARNESPLWNDSGFDVTFMSDATAPKSPSGIARATYLAGMTGGVGTATSEVYWGQTPKRTVYLSYWARLSPNFQGHSSGVNKQAYFYTPAFSGLFYFSAQGQGSGPLQPQIRTQNTVSPAGDANLGPNLVPSATVPRGQWYRIEIVAVGNTAGNRDGSVDWWLDGVHIGSYTGIQWESGNSTWGYFHWYDGWGGTGDVVAATMYIDFDHEYISGKP